MHQVSWADQLDHDPDASYGSHSTAAAAAAAYDDDGWDDCYHHHKFPDYSDPYNGMEATGLGGDHHDHSHGYNYQPHETSHLGVSDEDWNEAREELAHLGIPHSHSHSDSDSHYNHHHHHQDHYAEYQEEPYNQHQPGYGTDDDSVYQQIHNYQESESDRLPSSHLKFEESLGKNHPQRQDEFHQHHQHSFHSPLLEADSFSPARSDYYDHPSIDSHLNHGSESHRELIDHDYHIPSGEYHLGNDQHGASSYRDLSPDHTLLSSPHQNHHQSTLDTRGRDHMRFEEGHSPAITDYHPFEPPLSPSNDYNQFPHDDYGHDHHHHHLAPTSDDAQYRTSSDRGLSNAYQEPFGSSEHSRLEDDLPNLNHLSLGAPATGRFTRTAHPFSNPPLSPANHRLDHLADDLSSHARRPAYTSHQEYPRRDHYEHSAPQNYKEDDLYESLNYHPSPRGSLGHLRENDPRHVSPRDDIQRLRAELDDSLARDASLLVPQQTPERPLSRSWDPALSVSAHHSPYPRSFQPSPMASDLDAHGVRPPLVRPRSRSSIPHPVMPMEGSALHTTPLGRPRSRSGFAYPAVSGLRSPYPSGRRSPGLGLSSNTAWSSSPAVKMIPSVTRVETTLMGGLAHQLTGASLRRQNSLSDKVHEITELNNYIRDSELAQQRERALVDRATSDLARQSLADEVRRSEVNRERELALANQQVTQLAQHSLTKDLRRSEIAHQRDLAIAGQHASELNRQSMMMQQATTTAAREHEIYRDLEQQRRQLDQERAELARHRDRVETQSQLSVIDRQLRALDRQREIDANRQMANLSRFGNLPSVLGGSYAGRPLASPYLQQSRFLTAARRWSARDKPHLHKSPLVFDHVDAYYRLISDTLPRQLPLFNDPYYHHHHYPHDSSSYLVNSSSQSSLRRPLSSGVASSLMGRSMRMGNPFVEGIDYDYGYGKVGTLGLKLEQFAREQAYMLDDLYLYELLLRLDESIDEVERQRRWAARLRWEEWSDSRARVLAWSRMAPAERRRLGLAEGSYWASSLFGIPLDSCFGYSPTNSSSRFSAYRPSSHLMRSHYPLSERLRSRFPMWTRGGLGLGRRLSNWLDYHAPGSLVKPKHLDRQDQIRREYALRRGELLPGPPRSLLPTRVPSDSLIRLGGTTSRTLGQHLPPLTPSLSTTRRSSGGGLLSRGAISDLSGLLPRSSHRDLRSHITAPNVSLSLNPSAARESSAARRSSAVPSSSSILPIPNTRSTTLGSTSGAGSSGHSTAHRPGQPTATQRVPAKPTTTPSSSASSSLRPPQSTAPSSSSQTLTYSARPKTPSGGSTRPKTPTGVAFNPRVKAVPPESDSDPPPPPRPPSRNTAPPNRSVLKTPPPTSSANSTTALSHRHLDEGKLESITKINTQLNRATTPAPVSPKPSS
ncbi:hypothetical protein PCASD_22186 [Puccinia coronata f. sp. avenae]|uniref:Uncharacterized protein n=1 Tax=Puccinia coronata f. sp. avenae TaxID=200324 RepID=A0A2N5SJB0_9BASI|nr:hypothetical protein PCASD_22186 [Puccinia coronata f. sp. avenae]